MYENIINANDYIRYLEYLKLKTKELKNEIQEEIKNKQDIFEEFWNRRHELMSPNINLENIIFEKANNYIHRYFRNEFELDITRKLDMRSLVASKNSTIGRPNIKRPSQTEDNSNERMNMFGDYIQIGRFEYELNFDNYGRSKTQDILFQGFAPSNDKNPFFDYMPSSLIWENTFHHREDKRIIGLCKSLNGIESKCILWFSSYVLNDFGLILDNWNNGLKALDNDGDIILDFRCWRDELIDNGASFVGTCSNIAKIEGCDLILRQDYFDKLSLKFRGYEYISKVLRLG